MTRVVPFIKYQATGNDFILVEESALAAEEGPAFAKIACDRNFGIGSDGLILLGRDPSADVRMYFFNPDGTPDVCGNGLRCVGLHLYKTRSLKRVSIRTDAALVSVHTENGCEFSLESPVVAKPVSITASLTDRDVAGYLINTGTPHFVTFTDALTDESTSVLGASLEHHAAFPEAVSIDFVSVTDASSIAIRIWERSVGETLSCGTGASASALCAHAFKECGEDLNVQCRGGVLSVRSNRLDSFTLSGPAAQVFTGSLPFSG